MERKIAFFEVSVELDAVPGVFHTKESAEEVIQAILDAAIKHYHPNVVSK